MTNDLFSFQVTTIQNFAKFLTFYSTSFECLKCRKFEWYKKYLLHKEIYSEKNAYVLSYFLKDLEKWLHYANV